jgi:hypothetical protein
VFQAVGGSWFKCWVWAFLAEQLHVDPTVFQDYGTRRMTQSAHFQAVGRVPIFPANMWALIMASATPAAYCRD